MLFESLQPQQLFGVATDDVLGTHTEWVEAIEQACTSWRMISRELLTIPDTSAWVEQVCDFLGEAALQAWPNWSHASGRNPNGDPLWRRLANRCAKSGRIPLSKRWSRTFQLRQLSGALAAEHLVIALLIPSQEVDDERLLGLAKGVEWLAREANACVVLIIDSSLADRVALDSIPIERWTSPTKPIPSTHTANPAIEAATPMAIRMRAVKGAAVDCRKPMNEHKTVHPFLDIPHPGSPGEQLLYAKLESDSQLAGLFQCNQRTRTNRGTSHIVDLVWPDGKIVVEVDGYRFHSNGIAFRNDRQRDYELLISGYLVLRLAHECVMQDVSRAVEKIRDVVEFRTATMRHHEEVAPMNREVLYVT